MIESGLISLLNADATMSGLIAGRIYPLVLPETPTYPALTYRTISSVPTLDLNGNVIESKTRIEFTAWSTVYSDCKTIQKAIRNVLDSYSGTLPDGTIVQFTWRDGSAVDAFDDVRRAYNSSLDYRLIHTP
jgi:hypothetical protein